MSLGEKIREQCKKASLSQEQLAEKLNVSRQAITKWETGKGIPDVANLIAISDTFGLKKNGALFHRLRYQTAHLFCNALPFFTRDSHFSHVYFRITYTKNPIFLYPTRSF